MASYLLQESGFKITLEDGTGFILLETDGGTTPTAIADYIPTWRPRRRAWWWMLLPWLGDLRL